MSFVDASHVPPKKHFSRLARCGSDIVINAAKSKNHRALIQVEDFKFKRNYRIGVNAWVNEAYQDVDVINIRNTASALKPKNSDNNARRSNEETGNSVQKSVDISCKKDAVYMIKKPVNYWEQKNL